LYKQNTVYILGAGASWHYGYPTGEELVKEIRTVAKQLSEIFDQFVRFRIPPPQENTGTLLFLTPQNNGPFWARAKAGIDDFLRRLELVNPLVIDNFLSHQPPHLQTVGKMLICWILVDARRNFQAAKGNLNRIKALENSPNLSDRADASKIDVSRCDDQWYRFIIHKLTAEFPLKSLSENKVHFVTFNYDTSLEETLKSSLETFSHFSTDEIVEFLETRVIHCYGKIGSDSDAVWPISAFMKAIPNTQPINTNTAVKPRISTLEKIFELSEGIKTIQDVDKDLEVENHTRAKHVIQNAKTIYILGYGFDERNSRRIGLRPDHSFLNQKNILFTNFNNSGRVNKKASKVLTTPYHRNAIRTSFESETFSQDLSHWTVEKSVRNVYDALALDFDDAD
jgi:hypothetical protein